MPNGGGGSAPEMPAIPAPQRALLGPDLFRFARGWFTRFVNGRGFYSRLHGCEVPAGLIPPPSRAQIPSPCIDFDPQGLNAQAAGVTSARSRRLLYDFFITG